MNAFLVDECGLSCAGACCEHFASRQAPEPGVGTDLNLKVFGETLYSVPLSLARLSHVTFDFAMRSRATPGSGTPFLVLGSARHLGRLILAAVGLLSST